MVSFQPPLAPALRFGDLAGDSNDLGFPVRQPVPVGRQAVR